MKGKVDTDIYVLFLFIAGTTTNSNRAIINIKKVCEHCLAGKYKLKVIDIYQQPEALIKEQIVAVPVLIRKSPLPEMRIIGDLSDTDMVLTGLGITKE